MHGFIVKQFGGPQNMLWEDLPVPEPGSGQVRVNVYASGINFAETRMRAGTYSGQPLPYVCGMEGAGVVDALGEGVEEFRSAIGYSAAPAAVTPNRSCLTLNIYCRYPPTSALLKVPRSRLAG